MSAPIAENKVLPKDLIVVKNMVKYFPIRAGLLQRVVAWVQAVDDVSLTVREGETLGLVGEDHNRPLDAAPDRAYFWFGILCRD
jgi:ABC-type microcin C transport system duplicated ATPase subunit YejF